MNADLTFNSIVFKKSFDEKDGSERRSTARGINTPDIMTIRSQDMVDSATKSPGRRYTLSTDRVTLDSESKPVMNRIYTVIQLDSRAVSGDLTALLATHRAAVADADLLGAIVNNEK